MEDAKPRKNISLNALRTILMEELERLNDSEETCKTEKQVELEIARTKAMCHISEQFVDIGRLQVDALKIAGDFNYDKDDMPLLIER